jgi:peptide/nickel transport system substrate-binding protein
MRYNEAPVLRELVRAGKLPPVEQRLPREPMVIKPVEEIGQYGGTWRRSVPSPSGLMLGYRLGFESLVRWGPDGGSIIPDVAKSYEVSKDATRFTFHLRQGMKWSDGAPFTADDLEFWYKDILLNKELTPAIPSWLVIEGRPVEFKKIDDYTVEFRFAGSYGMFLKQMAFNGTGIFAPKHYLKNFHPAYTSKEELDRKVKEAQLDQWFKLFANVNNLVLTPDLPTIRPWKLTNAPPASTLFAERNPYYWKVDTSGNQLPYIDRMAVDIVESDEVINTRAATGVTDFEYQYLHFANWTLFQESAEKSGYRVLRWKMGETGITIFPNLNTTDKSLQSLFHNSKFRLALSLAMNRDEINEIVYLGMADPAWKQFIHESEWNESTEVLKARYKDLASRFRYDPAEANRLLDEIGLNKRDSQGYRLLPDGKPLSLIIEPYDGGLVYVDGFQIVRDNWEKVGVRTAIKPLSPSLWWPRIYSSEYQIAGYLNTRVAWQVYPRDWAPLRNHTYWAPLYGLWYDTGGQSGVEPSGDLRKAQQMFDKITSTPDDAERERLSKELLLMHGMNLWSIPAVGQFPAPYIAKNNFRNVPEEGYMVWSLYSPGYKAPEQFFIKQK